VTDTAPETVLPPTGQARESQTRNRVSMLMRGFEYRLKAPERLISVEDYRRAARRRLPQMIWTYVDGGADDLVSLHGNRDAFSRWWLKTQALTGHDRRDLSTTVAGVPLDLPVLLAPTGFAGLSYWKGDIAATRAAERHGTRYVVSTVSSWSIEEIADASSVGHFFQLYPRHGDLTASLMKRAWNAGHRVMFVTVDCAVKGNREGERKTGMGIPPVLTPRRMLNILRHPRWAYNVLAHQRVGGRSLVDTGGVTAALESIDIQTRELMQSTLNWDDLAWMRDQWKGPLFIKGILDPEDAERAVALGVDGIVVSNHGGRQLDFARPTLDALPDIVAAVGDRAEILLDGGVRRGSDVIKALALGARAVLIGRPYLYGMAVNGEKGVIHVLDIFKEEIDRTMALMGLASIRDLDPSWVIPRETAGEKLRDYQPR